MNGFDKAALDRLMALGRRRGHLTTGDLESELPISAMAPDEIALVIVHLEEAGIPVEVDAALLTGEHRPTAPGEGGIVLPARAADLPPAAPATLTGASAPSTPATPDDAGPAAQHPPRSAHRAVAIAGLLVIVILVALLAAAGA